MRHYSALETTGGFLSEERVQEQALFNVEAIAHLLLVVVVVFVAACTPYRVPAHLIDPIDLTSQQTDDAGAQVLPCLARHQHRRK